jgi:hypothetical protein
VSGQARDLLASICFLRQFLSVRQERATAARDSLPVLVFRRDQDFSRCCQAVFENSSRFVFSVSFCLCTRSAPLPREIRYRFSFLGMTKIFLAAPSQCLKIRVEQKKIGCAAWDRRFLKNSQRHPHPAGVGLSAPWSRPVHQVDCICFYRPQQIFWLDFGSCAVDFSYSSCGGLALV